MLWAPSLTNCPRTATGEIFLNRFSLVEFRPTLQRTRYPRVGFGNRQYEFGAAAVIEKFRERHSETHGNSGRRPDRVRLELPGIQITFASPLGGHLYGVLRV